MGPGASGSHSVRCTYFTAYIHACRRTNKQMRNHIYCNRVPREVSEVEVDEVGVSRFFFPRTNERKRARRLFVCLFVF